MSVGTNCNEDFCPSIGSLDPQIFHDISKNSGNIHLVGGIPTPLKNMSSSLGMIIPNIWKNKKMFQTTNQPLIDVGVQLWS